MSIYNYWSSKQNKWLKDKLGTVIATWLYAFEDCLLKLFLKTRTLNIVYQKYFYDNKRYLPVLSSSKNKSFDHRNQ